MLFKEARFKDEFWQVNPMVRLILCDVDVYSQQHFNKEIVVTDMMRTLDPSNPKPQPHAYGNAADLRSFIYTESELVEMKFYINQKYPYQTAGKDTFLVHDVGKGRHIHLQWLWNKSQ